jgi:hypothetical protein
MTESDKPARDTAHAFLVTRLKHQTWELKRLYGFDYIAPTCVKCDGILSKKSESPNLICLRCGIKYELKEQ